MSLPDPSIFPAARVRGLAARWAVIVALAFAALHGPSLAQRYEPNTWLFADGAFYFTTVRAVAQHGRLEQKDLQPRSWYEQDLGWNRYLTDDWSNVALGRNGGWYPKHPILLPLLSIPLYLLLGTPGTLLTNVLLNLLFVLLVFLLCRRVARVELAALVAVLVAQLPFVLTMSYTFSNDLLGACLLLGAVESALAGRFSLAGIFSGFAIWSRVTNGAFLPGLVVIGLAEGGWRAVWRSARSALVPLGIFALLNTYLFGRPWITSYQSVLVREAGIAKTASHSRLFNVPFLQGFRRVVFGQDGAFNSFPLLGPGLLGVLVLARRRPLWSLGIALFSVLPALVFMKYDWYRPHFLYPVYGLSAMGLAALGQLVLETPAPDTAPAWRLPRWGIAAIVAAILVGALGYRLATRPDPAKLSSHLRDAVVKLDDIACDYWNPQNERWECSHFDGEGWAMTGAILGPAVRVNGRPRRGIWLHPNPTGRWRRLIFPQLDGHEAELSFALGDQSHPGQVQIEVLARGQPVQSFELSRPGEEQRRTVTIAPGAGDALELRVAAPDAGWKHLVVEGTLH